MEFSNYGTAVFYGDTRMATTAPPLLRPWMGGLHDAAFPPTWTVIWLASAVSVAVMKARLLVLNMALPDKPSIAVMPFQNMSGDPEQEYFAGGERRISIH